MDAHKKSKKRHRSIGIGGPLILIALGVVFLLNNLGVITISIWELIFRFWPVLLIAAGLDILLGRSRLGSAVALLLALAILGGAIWLSVSAPQRAWAGEEIGYELGKADQAEIYIAPGLGNLHVAPLSDSGNLLEGTLRGPETAADFEIQDGTAYVSLENVEHTFGPFAGDEYQWWLELTPDLPIDLTGDLGVGEAVVDLTGMEISALHVRSDVGRAKVTLPRRGTFKAFVAVDVGEAVIVIPEGLGARVTFDNGLAARQLPSGYTCRDEVCTSANYAAADHKVDLAVSVDIGSVVIR